MNAALKCFGHRGYAATSVQEIVDAAKVSKPALYYYFADKAGLFQALVDEAHDERYRLMQEAAGRATDLRGQLVEILAAMFEYVRGNRERLRITFAITFAAPGELPQRLEYLPKCERNFQFVEDLMKRGQASGALDSRFTSLELTHGFYGQVSAYILSHILRPECVLDRRAAERIVALFLEGGAPRARANSRAKARRMARTT